ncbi:MAG: hypothetical protein CMH26_02800 [Micavibrio sp.]|nr:hypothetical protein [Micavibrio sp.]
MIKSLRYWCVALLLAFSFHCCFATVSHAQSILDIFEKPMPKMEGEDYDTFVKNSKFEEEYPVGSRDLSYEVRLPQDWEKAEGVSMSSLVVDDNILSTINKYWGPVSTGTRHYMTVQVVGLKVQMTAKDWFVRYILDNQYTVQGVDVIDDRDAEALYIFVQDNVSYVTRSRVIISGKKVIFVQHYLPIEEWHDNKVAQAHMLKSFQLKYPSEEVVEELLAAQMLDIAEFKYPETWELKPGAMRSVDRVKSQLLNVDKSPTGQRILDGQIDLQLVSVFATEGIEEELDNIQDDLVKRGLFIQEEMDDHTQYMFDGTDLVGTTYVYQLADKNMSIKAYEYWITIMAYGDYFYFMTLTTPSRETDFFKWSRNVQTYQTVSRYFKNIETSALE